MTKDNYIQITSKPQVDINQVFLLSDAYLSEINKEFDVRGLYNLSQYHLQDQNGFPIQINAQLMLENVFNACKKYFDEKFEIQRYVCTFDEVKDTKLKKSIINRLKSNQYHYLTS